MNSKSSDDLIIEQLNALINGGAVDTSSNQQTAQKSQPRAKKQTTPKSGAKKSTKTKMQTHFGTKYLNMVKNSE